MLDLEAILNPTSPTAVNETPACINDSDCSDVTNDHTTPLPTNSESSGLEESKERLEVEETNAPEPESEAAPEAEPRDEKPEEVVLHAPNEEKREATLYTTDEETRELPLYKTGEDEQEVNLYTTDEEKQEGPLYTTEEEKSEVTLYTPDEEESLKTGEAEREEKSVEEVEESGGDNFIPPFNNPLYPNNSYSEFGTGSVIGE